MNFTLQKMSPIAGEPSSIQLSPLWSVFMLEWFSSTLNKDATLTLLYYAGYLTMTVCDFYPTVLSVLISVKANDCFKIPNPEVMADWADWARWAVGDVESCNHIYSKL